MNRTALIINPAARSQKGQNFVAEIQRFGSNVKLAMTSAPGDARKLASELVRDGFTSIVAAGGDGTINDVVNGIASSLPTDAPLPVKLGVLPLGTLNVFAYELGIPPKLADAWRVIEAGKTRAIDLACVRCVKDEKPLTHYFVQLAGIGLDAQAVQEVNWDMKKLWGPLSYVFAGLKAAAAPAPQLTIETDAVTQKGTFVIIGNGRHYGGPFVVFPKASNSDGKLDVCVFQGATYLDFLRYFQGILRGVHADFPDVKFLSGSRIKVTSADAVPLEVDGELLGFTPAEFDLRPSALQVFAP